MKRVTLLGMVLLLVFAAACSTPAASAAPKTFAVLVGATDTRSGADLEAYFPATIRVHVGDTVDWKLNSKEIHTVTFLGNLTQVPAVMMPIPNGPQGAMMLNPQAAFPITPKDGKYDGSTYANSGIMGPDEGQSKDFSLTFTKTGTYKYVCVIHNDEKMFGTVIVQDANVNIPAQAEDQAQGQQELSALQAQVPSVQQAVAALAKDEKNADGTTTHTIAVGGSLGQIDLQAFYPNKLNVQPGDTVTWVFAKGDLAPHTITFLNGAKEPDLVIPQPQPNGPPWLVINPDVAQPQNADKPLTTQGIYSSGLIDPHAPGPHTFSLKVGDVTGDIQYMCVLHNDSGMTGTLSILSATAAPVAPGPIVAAAQNPTLGSILTDGKGMTLYVFTKDAPGVSNCYGQCAQQWPPLTVAPGVTPTADQGVNLTLGTIQRTDGTTQVTINGMPAYYWYKDSKPGDASGQGVGGVWYVLDPAGKIKP